VNPNPLPKYNTKNATATPLNNSASCLALVSKNNWYDGLNKTFGTELLFLACNHEILPFYLRNFMVAGQQ
jgi:hypothetical protein